MEQNKPTPEQSPSPAPQTEKQKRKLFLPIFLMVWPALLVVLVIVLYAIVNFIFASTAEVSGDELFNDGPAEPLRVVTNVFLFLTGAIGIIAGPVSFIIGLVLLVQRLGKK